MARRRDRTARKEARPLQRLAALDEGPPLFQNLSLRKRKVRGAPTLLPSYFVLPEMVVPPALSTSSIR